MYKRQFLTGTKQSSASVELEDASGWWLKFRGQQVSKFKASTGTEQGTTLNRLLLKSPYQASDGAAPLFSQQAAGLYGAEAIDMGDTDHEQFYGAEPAQRNADSLRKGRLTAERTLHEGRLDRTENTCPSIQGLALSAGSGTVTVAGRAFFPALASAPAKTGALIARVEARAGLAPARARGAGGAGGANPPRRGPGAARRGDLATMLGLDEADVAPDPTQPPLWVDTGSEQLIIPLASAEAVRRARPVSYTHLTLPTSDLV